MLYFSRIPDRFSILNVRFLSMFPTLFYAAVTGHAIWQLFGRFTKLRILLTCITAFLMAISVPLGMQQLFARNGLFVPDNSWAYLTLDAYRTYEEAVKISRPGDIFFIVYPFDASFVGLTGRRIYTSYSNPLWRVNFEEKQKRIDALYSGTVTNEEKKDLLKQSHIAYIISYTWIAPPYSGLTPVYQNGLMTIYKVPAL
jgi:hypothetical protein